MKSTRTVHFSWTDDFCLHCRRKFFLFQGDMVPSTGLGPKRRARHADGGKSPLPSPGEIHYLWWYMQGSIMNPDVRRTLHKAWGFCEHHAWVALLVETSFRNHFLMGPALVYEDLMNKAVKAFSVRGPMKNLQLAAGLRERGQCLMCSMNLDHERAGIVGEDLVEEGSNAAPLLEFAENTRPHWEGMICGRCSGANAWPRCRTHLVEEAVSGNLKHFPRHRAMVKSLQKQITAYGRGFTWDLRGTATAEDKAAMISVVGWSSGWRPLLALTGREKKSR